MADTAVGCGNLLWAGEHWINYIRPVGSDENTGMVSLYHAYYSPAGRGTTAYVDVGGDNGFRGVCSDNRDFARFIDDRMIRGNPYSRNSPWLRSLPEHDAKLTRSGDIRTHPTWTIETGETCLVASWSALEEPIVGPPTIHEEIVFTIFFFAGEASIGLNGHKVAGDPYPNAAWSQNLGSPHSSCVFALAETMVSAE